MDADEAQLDTALVNRGKIFKERIQKETSASQGALAKSTVVVDQKSSKPDSVQFYGNYGLNHVEIDKQHVKVLPDRKRVVPIHEPA